MIKIRVGLVVSLIILTVVLLSIVMKLQLRVDGLEERMASQETTRVRM